jgi:ubiquinone/menaquinone biosynthesis C-methylase UbiE
MKELSKQPQKPLKKSATTSWGAHAQWYEGVVGDAGSYQREVILPNVLRLLELKKGDDMLDVGCGEGMFAREFYKTGASVAGIEISSELVEVARRKSPPVIIYRIGDAKNLSFLNDNVFDAAASVLALQNMDDLNAAFREVRRVLKKDGRLLIVLNHPMFRVPKFSSWGWDDEQKVQYRRIDGYMSEAKISIQMHPGDDPKAVTWSFHRPLQTYMKALRNNGFLVETPEEWTSHKKSEPGLRAKAEDHARKEIPLFMAIKAVAR